MAVTELAPHPVSLSLVNLTYILLIWELVNRSPPDEMPAKHRKVMHIRSIATLCFLVERPSSR
jgi:hypothetical protein